MQSYDKVHVPYTCRKKINVLKHKEIFLLAKLKNGSSLFNAVLPKVCAESEKRLILDMFTFTENQNIG